MAAELQAVFSIEARLFAEAKGIFDVIIDGELLYSKYQTGRFPNENEICDLIKA